MHTRGLGWAGLVDQLQPVIQAAKLLQMKKSSREDAAAIIELCTHLNPLQVRTLSTTTDHSSLITLINNLQHKHFLALCTL